MEPFAWLLIFSGVLVLRQVAVGRASTIPQDSVELVSDAFSGDWAGVSDVASRRGTAVGGDSTGTALGSGASSLADDLANASALHSGVVLLAEAEKLGAAAKGYQIGATGPDYYDCSGLVWAALRATSLPKVARFTTATWVSVATKSGYQKTTAAATGDIVHWVAANGHQYGHMGIVTSGGNFYSALDTAEGIKETTIAAVTKSLGAPDYWQLLPSAPIEIPAPKGSSPGTKKVTGGGTPGVGHGSRGVDAP